MCVFGFDLSAITIDPIHIVTAATHCHNLIIANNIVCIVILCYTISHQIQLLMFMNANLSKILKTNICNSEGN